jgi:hypothetical protein
MAEALTDALESVESPAPEAEAVNEDAEEFLNNLVGEGKKYNSANDLAKAYHHINIHVDELKSDLDQYKGGKELLNEVLDEIRNSNTEESTSISAPPQAPVETRPQTEDVAKLVSDEFSRKEKEAVEKRNVQDSFEKLTKIYGSESQAKAAVAKTISGDSHIKDTIDNLSLTSPDAMVKFITGITPAGTTVEGNTPGVNASTGAPIAPTGLTWEQCRQIRKDDPRKYASPEFRQAMEAAANLAAAKGVDYFAT